MDDTITINVGGELITIFHEHLEHVPASRLSEVILFGKGDLSDGIVNSINSKSFYNKYIRPHPHKQLVYFFDRSSTLANIILNIYRLRDHSEFILIPHGVCPRMFLEELRYWKISHERFRISCVKSEIIESVVCPISTSSQQSESDSTQQSTVIEKQSTKAAKSLNQRTKDCILSGSAKQTIWLTMEDPSYSKFAMFYMTVCFSVVLFSMALLMMSSMKEFGQSKSNQFQSNYNSTAIPDQSQTVQPWIEDADAGCVIFFSLDFLLRWVTTPNRVQYWMTPLTLVDVFAILPFYLELIMSKLGLTNQSFGDMRRSLVILRILRILRVLRALRVLKVARYSTGIRSMASALKNSFSEIGLLILCIAVTNLVFATSVYYVELENSCAMLNTIPEALWWCVITMTTVGYGDVYPCTPLGKVLASFACITGILLMAFPISVIVGNFGDKYEQSKGRERTEASSTKQIIFTDRNMNEHKMAKQHMNGI